MAAMTNPYPVNYEIPRPERYNRWTVLFRIILAIPQLILVGGGGYYFSWLFGRGNRFSYFTGSGLLGTVLWLLVFFAWFVILFTGRFPGYRNFCLMIFRWQQNVQAYMSLQAAPYPPFGDGPYPLDIQVIPAESYSRWTVAFRIILAIPHYIILFFLGIAQAVVTIIAWFAILITGQYPEGLFNFSVGVSRWGARVAAYMYLFVDQYPPFALVTTPSETPIIPPSATGDGASMGGLPAVD